MKEVNIYIDAIVRDNKIGGYGAILEYNGSTKEILSAFLRTTERRVRLFGVTDALKSLKEPCDVTIYIASKYAEYIVSGIREDSWAEKWRMRNWRISDGEKAKNDDLWKELFELIKKHNVRIKVIKRNGHEYGCEYFERCDELAEKAVIMEETKCLNFI